MSEDLAEARISDAERIDTTARSPVTRWWLTLDAIVVLAFVVVGRSTHQESQTMLDIIETAAPFLWALLAAWAITRAWRDPVGWPVGFGVLVITYVGGVLARRFVYQDGIATAFIVVTGLFFAVTLLGWRALVRLGYARRRRSAARAG